MSTLCNTSGNQELENILLRYISHDKLKFLRKYIAPTSLVTGRQKIGKDEGYVSYNQGFVFKTPLVASSKKKKLTVFSHELNFQTSLEKAFKNHDNFVLQREVTNFTQPLSYFKANGSLDTADWFTKMTVCCIAGELAEVTVTACLDKKVGGGPNCLRLGTKIV